MVSMKNNILALENFNKQIKLGEIRESRKEIELNLEKVNYRIKNKKLKEINNSEYIGTLKKDILGTLKASEIRINFNKNLEIINKSKTICNLTSKDIKIKIITLITIMKKTKNSNIVNVNYSCEYINPYNFYQN